MQWKYNTILKTGPGHAIWLRLAMWALSVDMSAGSFVECTKWDRRRRRLLLISWGFGTTTKKKRGIKEEKNSVTELNWNLWPECNARQMCWGCRGDVFWMSRSDLRYRRRKQAEKRTSTKGVGWRGKRYRPESIEVEIIQKETTFFFFPGNNTLPQETPSFHSCGHLYYTVDPLNITLYFYPFSSASVALFYRPTILRVSKVC